MGMVLGGGETPGNSIDPLAEMAPKFSSRNSCKLRMTSRSRFLLCRMRRTCRITKKPATMARVAKATDPATAPADRSEPGGLSRSSISPIESAVFRNSQCGPSNNGGQSHEKSTTFPFMTSRHFPPFRQKAGTAMPSEYSGPSVGIQSSIRRFSSQPLPPKYGVEQAHENSVVPPGLTKLSHIAPCRHTVFPSSHVSDKCSHRIPPNPVGQSQ
mmetsp:Transcript_2307/g.4974  ORF Transcript_2307/g.4974 Transcript_2307/m.4974 type:complete len:213 (-) Transcript_2307:1155-1793(-)